MSRVIRWLVNRLSFLVTFNIIYRPSAERASVNRYLLLRSFSLGLHYTVGILKDPVDIIDDPYAYVIYEQAEEWIETKRRLVVVVLVDATGSLMIYA